MNNSQELIGSCLCETNHFKISGAPHLVEYCHCNSCRNATGATVMALAGLTLADFEIAQAKLTCYASSLSVEGLFVISVEHP